MQVKSYERLKNGEHFPYQNGNSSLFEVEEDKYRGQKLIFSYRTMANFSESFRGPAGHLKNAATSDTTSFCFCYMLNLDEIYITMMLVLRAILL